MVLYPELNSVEDVRNDEHDNHKLHLWIARKWLSVVYTRRETMWRSESILHPPLTDASQQPRALNGVTASANPTPRIAFVTATITIHANSCSSHGLHKTPTTVSCADATKHSYILARHSRAIVSTPLQALPAPPVGCTSLCSQQQPVDDHSKRRVCEKVDKIKRTLQPCTLYVKPS